MTSYEKNIVEIKKEYTNFLLDMITPLLFEGVSSIYLNCIEQHEKLLKKNKYSTKASPGILKLFQLHLKEIPLLTTHKIETETNRIREASKCSSWFDELIRAIVKSNIILLTFSSEIPDIVRENHHEKIIISDFIHKCYIECAKNFYNSPHLFWHELSSIEIKKNQKQILKIIKKSIKNAIRKMLPIKYILDEYLHSDYPTKEYEYETIKDMVFKVLEEEQYIKEPTYNYNEEDKESIKVCKINSETPIIENIVNNEPEIIVVEPEVNPKNEVAEVKKKGTLSINEDPEFAKAIESLDKTNIIFDLDNTKKNNKENYFAQFA